jgi:signal transduction histidine kinase
MALSALACLCGISYAQPAAGLVPLRDEVLTTWTTQDGLPQNFITAIAQTSDGFLWIGTMGGLARFDGLHFRSFEHDGPEDLQGNIGALSADGNNGLWIVVRDTLIHYTGGRFVSVPVAGKHQYQIEAVGRASNGELLFFAQQKLWQTAAGGVQQIPLPSEARHLIDIAQGTHGKLWIVVNDAVIRVEHGQVTGRYPVPGCEMIYADSFSGIWAGDGHRLFRFDGNTFALQKNPGLGNFVSLLVDRQSRLWMASGGLHGVSRKSGKVTEVLTAADGLASDDVRTIFEDRSGDIWLGTIAGLERLHRGIFTTDSRLENLLGPRAQIDSVFEQHNGAIWAGSLEGGVARLKDGEWSHFGIRKGLEPGQVRGFLDHGDMPAITIADYGIFEWNDGAFRKIPNIPHGYISTPITAADGSAWFVVSGSGLYRMLHGHITQLDAKENLAPGAIWGLAVDKYGMPWISTHSTLQRWDGAHFVTVTDTVSPVISLAWPSKGVIAAGTMNGILLRAPDGHSRMLTQREGLQGSAVLDVLADDEDNLWVATFTRIVQIKHRQWLDYLEGRTQSVQPITFTPEDGLKSGYVLPLSSVTAIRGQDGRIWFATIHGLSVVAPHLPPFPLVDAVVDSIQVDEKQHPGGDLIIPPGRHRLTFVYTSPPTTAPAQIRYRYRLDGWDRGWIDGGTTREVSYSGLPPGRYTFELVAINREGLASPHVASVRLQLRPYFWQTRWFLVLLCCAAAAIVIEVTRQFTHRKAEKLSLRFQERVAERERIAYQIHDTVIQDMIGATLQLELIGFEVADQPQRSEESLHSLAARMRQTITRSRNMVSNLHSTAVPQYSLVEVLRHAEAEFRLSELPLFELTSSGQARPVHPLVRDEVYRICREALVNAFRHANATLVTVDVRFRPEMIEVEIADDGQGMSPELLEHGRAGHFGLRGMQAHARRIGATLTIESEPSQGTNVILRVRTRRLSWRRRLRKETKRA